VWIDDLFIIPVENTTEGIEDKKAEFAPLPGEEEEEEIEEVNHLNENEESAIEEHEEQEQEPEQQESTLPLPFPGSQDTENIFPVK
jgi:hypothetical protein